MHPALGFSQGQTIIAFLTGNENMDDDVVSNPYPGRFLANLGDDPRNLMPRDHGGGHLPSIHDAHLDPIIQAPDGAGLYSHQRIPGARARDRNLLQSQRLFKLL
jgi:hypothetical protein